MNIYYVTLYGGVFITNLFLTSISINRPVTGSYRVYTEQFLGKFTAYLLGWIIYISGILGTAAEAISAAVFSMNISWASPFINGIIIIATTSVMIGNYYSCDQMLVSLSEAKEAPSIFKIKTDNNFYLNAWILTGITSLLVVMMSFLLSAKLFNYLISACSYFSFFTWVINLIVYIIWLKKRSIEEKYTYPLIWGRKGAYGTIICILILFVTSLQVHEFRIGFYSAAIITILIGMSYKLKTTISK